MKKLEIVLLYCSDYSIAHYGESRKEFPPIGAMYLGAACEARGIRVSLMDLSTIKPGDIPQSSIIGLSINSSYIYSAFKRRISEIRTKCQLLFVGGQHATIFPEETFVDLQADYLLIGEGEYTLPELIFECYKTNLENKEIDFIPTVFCRKNIIEAAYSESFRIKNLDSLPFPARHLLPREDILLRQRIPGYDIYSTTIITSRGCPYSCQFCGNVYKGFHFRSGGNVASEIWDIIRNYPEVKGLVFLDENLFFSNIHALDIISCMKKFQLKWTCNARIDGHTKELLPYLKRSNCVEIKYGIESGCQRILDLMKKGVSVCDMEETLKATVENGIGTKCFLMFGFPGDNVESAMETINFLERNRKNIGRVNLFSFTPVPNSPIFKKKICNEYSWEDYKIYHQLRHWWGTLEQYEQVKEGYHMLKSYIDDIYGGE